MNVTENDNDNSFEQKILENKLVIIVLDDNFICFRCLIQFNTEESDLLVSPELIATDLADKMNRV